MNIRPLALRRTGGSENYRRETAQPAAALRRTGGSEIADFVNYSGSAALRRTGGSETAFSHCASG